MDTKPPTRTLPKLVMKEWPKLDPETCIANLRHAYSQLSAGTVVDQCSFAQGLLGPAIEGLEDFTRVVEETGILDQERPQKEKSR